MKIAFIGAGRVGAPLAARLTEAGHDVTLAQRREGSAAIKQALARSERLSARPTPEALAAAEVVFLAVPFKVVESVLPPLAGALAGKVLVDCTNPVGPGLSHGLESRQAGSELVQSLVTDAAVVKAFSIYGFENLEEPTFPDYNVRPAMFYCGDDTSAKSAVAKLITACGFDPLDVGGLDQALHLEHMTLLWVRMVRVNKHSPRLTWAALTAPRS